MFIFPGEVMASFRIVSDYGGQLRAQRTIARDLLSRYAYHRPSTTKVRVPQKNCSHDQDLPYERSRRKGG